MRHPISLALLALCVAACGSEIEAPAGADPVPQEQGAEDQSLAALAMREAEEREAQQSQGIRELGWEELMPEGEEERLAQLYQQQMQMLYSGAPIAEGSAGDQAIQIGTFNTVAELNGVRVRIPGYTVPFEFGADAKITEFLLVPYFGACLHAPPPPPNQTLFVMTDDPITMRDLAQAVWIEGTLYTQTQESELADAAYTLELESIEIYEY
ncbi:MAG: DUF3299 domain-containing protein [Hyphomonadaceae bacterium]|nr:DUF3299 domain-containing protein [Hyphomonadaceae bacterium]